MTNEVTFKDKFIWVETHTSLHSPGSETAIAAGELAANWIEKIYEEHNGSSSVPESIIEDLEMEHEELLKSLDIILNAYQDIEDELNVREPDMLSIRIANQKIGKEVVKHLPG